jgi:hypothetical protein
MPRAPYQIHNTETMNSEGASGGETDRRRSVALAVIERLDKPWEQGGAELRLALKAGKGKTAEALLEVNTWNVDNALDAMSDGRVPWFTRDHLAVMWALGRMAPGQHRNPDGSRSIYASIRGYICHKARIGHDRAYKCLKHLENRCGLKKDDSTGGNRPPLFTFDLVETYIEIGRCWCPDLVPSDLAPGGSTVRGADSTPVFAVRGADHIDNSPEEEDPELPTVAQSPSSSSDHDQRTNCPPGGASPDGEATDHGIEPYPIGENLRAFLEHDLTGGSSGGARRRSRRTPAKRGPISRGQVRCPPGGQ